MADTHSRLTSRGWGGMNTQSANEDLPMDSISKLASALSHADPAALVACVSIVALLVIYQVVRHLTGSKKD